MFKKIVLFSCFLLCAWVAFSQELPPRSNTLVTDLTNSTLSGSDQQRLESKLTIFNDSTSSQIAVLIMHSVGQYDINDYGQKVLRAWGIGQKGKNNGVLILLAIDDHKVTIQTGYGMEGALPDITTHQIIQNDITPHFKQNDYYGGLDAATDDIIKAVKGEYKADAKSQSDSGGGGSALIIVVIVVVVLILIFRNRGGGGGQIIDRRGSASPFWWFLGGAMLGRESGGWGGFSNGGGDGGFGGGDGGGGFGGFGGGDGGGGGSSGSW